jgi:hypothetical protein
LPPAREVPGSSTRASGPAAERPDQPAKATAGAGKPRKELIEKDKELIAAKEKGKREQQRQKSAKERQELDKDAAEQRKSREEERKEKTKKKTQDRPDPKASAPPGSDQAFQKTIDQAVKQDLNRTGRYKGIEQWQITRVEGPYNLATSDPVLDEGRGVRYQATFQRPDGSVIEVSVNYDPIGGHFGTIKESSGKPVK